MKQEMEQDLDRLDDTSGDLNPYWEIIVNNAESIDTVPSQNLIADGTVVNTR